MMTRAVSLLSMVLALGVLTSCDTTCDRACNKLIVDCSGGFPSYNTETCQEDCELIQKEYNSHDYLEPEQTAFQTQLNCIGESTCDALLNPTSPACYTDDTKRLWAF